MAASSPAAAAAPAAAFPAADGGAAGLSSPSGAATVITQRLGGGVIGQAAAGALGRRLVLLAEQEVGERAGVRRRRQVGRERLQRRAGAGADRLLGHAEQLASSPYERPWRSTSSKAARWSGASESSGLAARGGVITPGQG